MWIMQYKRTVVINYTKERCYLGVKVIWSVGLRNSEGEKCTEVITAPIQLSIIRKLTGRPFAMISNLCTMLDRWHFELGERFVVPASLLHSKCHFVSRKDIIIAKKCLKYLTFSLFLLHEYFNYLPTRYTSLIDHITSATLSKLSPKKVF